MGCGVWQVVGGAVEKRVCKDYTPLQCPCREMEVQTIVLIILTPMTSSRLPLDSSTSLLPGTKGYRNIREAKWRREHPFSFGLWAALSPILWITHAIAVFLCGFFVVYIPMVSTVSEIKQTNSTSCRESARGHWWVASPPLPFEGGGERTFSNLSVR